MSWADSVISSTLASIADDHALGLDERRRSKARRVPVTTKTRSAATTDVRGRDETAAPRALQWEWVQWREWGRASLSRACANVPSQCSAKVARAAIVRLTLRQNLLLLVIATVAVGLVVGITIGKGMVSALALHHPTGDAQARASARAARFPQLLGEDDGWGGNIDASASVQLQRGATRPDAKRQQSHRPQPRNHIGMAIGCFERGYYCCGRIRALPSILHAEIIGSVEVEVCHSLCQQTPSCHVFSWRAADGACHLKPASPGRFKRGRGHLSAAKNCTLPTKAALQRLTDSVDPAQPPLLRGGTTHAATLHGVGGTSPLREYATAPAPLGGFDRGNGAPALAAALPPAPVRAEPRGGAGTPGVLRGGGEFILFTVTFLTRILLTI